MVSRTQIFFLLFCSITCSAHFIDAQAAGKSALPIIGKNYTLTYDPKTTGAFKKTRDLKVICAFDFWGTHRENSAGFWSDVEDTSNPRRHMLQLKKKGNSWSTSLLIPRKAQVLSYVITDGLLVDDNGKRTFVLPLFGDDGRPVQGAYLRFDDLIRLTGGSYEAQYSAAKREKDLYPRNYSSYYAYWRLWYLRSRASKQVRDSIVEEIEHLLARDSLDVDLWNAVAVTYYYTLRDWDKSWELKNRISETDRWPMTVEIKDVRKAEEEGKKIKADGEKRREALLNNMAPDFRLKSFKGDTVSLSDLRGNVVLVCFWSSSGGPSRILAPRLQFLLDVNRGTQLRLLSISLDMKREDVPPFEAARELTFPVLYGDEQISSQYGIVSLPTTYLVDKSGKIRHIHVGFVLGRGLEWLEEIHALIKEP